jgi:hypothetical protein
MNKESDRRKHSEVAVNSDQAATASRASVEEQERVREAFRFMGDRARAFLEREDNNDPRKRWPSDRTY